MQCYFLKKVADVEPKVPWKYLAYSWFITKHKVSIVIYNGDKK